MDPKKNSVSGSIIVIVIIMIIIIMIIMIIIIIIVIVIVIIVIIVIIVVIRVIIIGKMIIMMIAPLGPEEEQRVRRHVLQQTVGARIEHPHQAAQRDVDSPPGCV